MAGTKFLVAFFVIACVAAYPQITILEAQHTLPPPPAKAVTTDTYSDYYGYVNEYYDRYYDGYYYDSYYYGYYEGFSDGRNTGNQIRYCPFSYARYTPGCSAASGYQASKYFGSDHTAYYYPEVYR